MPKGAQILVFCYHKTGTVLFGNVLRMVCRRLRLSFQERYGFVDVADPGADVVLLSHGLLGALPTGPFRAVRVVRDPRDVWVSGYLYHRHCQEPWCVNDAVVPAGVPGGGIGFPQVPRAFVHRRERWKRDWLARLGGRSYQANLLGLDREAGLAFELAGYAGATLEDMAEWQFGQVVPDVRLEEVAADFDGAWARVFTALGFEERVIPELVDLAGAEDVGRMSEAAVAARPHIHGRRLAKWRGVLSPAQAHGFARRHGALLARLRYPAE